MEEKEDKMEPTLCPTRSLSSEKLCIARKRSPRPKNMRFSRTVSLNKTPILSNYMITVMRRNGCSMKPPAFILPPPSQSHSKLDVSHVFPFNEQPQEIRDLLVDRLTEVEFEKGSTIQNSIFYIESGFCRTEGGDFKQSGEWIGELTFFKSSKSPVYYAESKVVALTISFSSFWDTVTWYNRHKREVISNVLNNLEFMAQLKQTQRQLVLDMVRTEYVPQGSTLETIHERVLVFTISGICKKLDKTTNVLLDGTAFFNTESKAMLMAQTNCTFGLLDLIAVENALKIPCTLGFLTPSTRE